MGKGRPKKKKKIKMATKKKAVSAKGAGFGLALAAAAAAAAAGAYFVYGKDGAKNRKKISSWALKAKGEVLERLEKMKEVDQQAYAKVVDAVTARYAAVKGVDKAELAQMVRELKGHWDSIAKQIAKPALKAKRKTSK
jgi:uncharacterized protein HemX